MSLFHSIRTDIKLNTPFLLEFSLSVGNHFEGVTRNWSNRRYCLIFIVYERTWGTSKVHPKVTQALSKVTRYLLSTLPWLLCLGCPFNKKIYRYKKEKEEFLTAAPKPGPGVNYSTNRRWIVWHICRIRGPLVLLSGRYKNKSGER